MGIGFSSISLFYSIMLTVVFFYKKRLQLLENNIPIILVLNMHEIAEKKGIKIDEKKLSQELENIPVIKISALTGQGIERVKSELADNKNNKSTDGVIFTTMHSAKGLEFKNVYIIGANEGTIPHEKSYDIDDEDTKLEQIEEERRLMYGAQRLHEIA